MQATLADLTAEQKDGQPFTPVVTNPDPEVVLPAVREVGIEPGASWHGPGSEGGPADPRVTTLPV